MTLNMWRITAVASATWGMFVQRELAGKEKAKSLDEAKLRTAHEILHLHKDMLQIEVESRNHRAEMQFNDKMCADVIAEMGLYIPRLFSAHRSK